MNFSVTSQLYAAARGLTSLDTQPTPPSSPVAPLPPTPPLDEAGEAASGFGPQLIGVAKETVASLRAGEDASKAMIAGKADPHSVVEALAQAELAVELAVTVRDKVVQAYNDILRMPI